MFASRDAYWHGTGRNPALQAGHSSTHLPSGQFASNGAWAICAAIMHNLLRAAGTLASDRHALARGTTLRRHLVAVPARLARPQRRPVLHLPEHWPWHEAWQRLWASVADPPKAA